MSSSNYKFQPFRFEEGQRSALLVHRETGIPLYYQNLYITLHHFKKARSINTIKAVLLALGQLAEICDLMKLDIEKRFKDGQVLTISEIELIATWLMKPVERIYEAKSMESASNIVLLKQKKIKLAKFTVLIDEDLVKPETAYNRIWFITEYLTWLASRFTSANSIDIDKMKMRFHRQLPTKINRFNDNRNFKSLGDQEKIAMLELLEINSKNNPWKDEAVKFRNKLIVHILLYIGCRKGELLTLRATEINPNDRLLRINRLVDSVDDNRTTPALVKTLGRDIEVNDALHVLIQDYILKYRSKVKGANKTPYLFISHQNGAGNAKPLSHSSVDSIFKDMSDILGFNVFPHALRHTWNDKLSEDIEEFLDSGELTTSEVEDLRSYLMGWKEGSKSAKFYTRQYEQKKAMRVGLYLQKRAHETDKQLMM